MNYLLLERCLHSRHQECRAQIKGIMDSETDDYGKSSHATIFHEILKSDLPPNEKTVDRLWQEAQILVAAGTETTAWTLSVITFHLLSNPHQLQRLRRELEEVMPNPAKPASCTELEKLPYLVGSPYLVDFKGFFY